MLLASISMDPGKTDRAGSRAHLHILWPTELLLPLNLNSQRLYSLLTKHQVFKYMRFGGTFHNKTTIISHILVGDNHNKQGKYQIYDLLKTH